MVGSFISDLDCIFVTAFTPLFGRRRICWNRLRSTDNFAMYAQSVLKQQRFVCFTNTTSIILKETEVAIFL